ncbi:coiled-coil domain-containing protein 187 isoform X6 [Acipenser ruthenus]|uniref:coiled-coil domain-containing protein 187 isoform X6 n=1 Tax=Acipenser ruthenus TaxID=7906 RepID=UPI0027415D4C|nr:coiled-coil domain-containing protein 187 isoform X6 [Acipenser ruthenus]
MTELEIDQSHLPRVQEVCQGFAVLEDGALAHNLQEQEIEQYYASNVQKNQLVQRDVRIAKRLQDEEDQRRRLTDCRRQMNISSRASRCSEEQDSEYAQTIQEDIRRRAEEARRREEQDEEIAKKLQEEEELEIRRRRLDSGCQGNQTGLLSNREGGSCAGAAPPAGLHAEVAQMGLQDREQVLRDAELARRLQEEEEEEERLLRKGQRPGNDISPPSPASTGRLRDQAEEEEDFRAAQVAQDEEIARFMQRQEMKASRDLEGQGSRMEHSDLTDSSERRRSQNRKAEAPPGQHERLDSEGLPSPREEGSPDRRASSVHRQQQHLLPRNIAEELDPTFRVKRQEDAAEEPALPTPAAARSPPGPPCRFHDYTDERAEPTFIPPTKRQSDKISRPKTKDRKEGCKQQ